MQATVQWVNWFPDTLIRTPDEQNASHAKLRERLEKDGWVFVSPVAATRNGHELRLTRRYESGKDNWAALESAGLWRDGQASAVVSRSEAL